MCGIERGNDLVPDVFAVWNLGCNLWLVVFYPWKFLHLISAAFPPQICSWSETHIFTWLQLIQILPSSLSDLNYYAHFIQQNCIRFTLNKNYASHLSLCCAVVISVCLFLFFGTLKIKPFKQDCRQRALTDLRVQLSSVLTQLRYTVSPFLKARRQL